MMKNNCIKPTLSREQGASLLEYALLIALIFGVALAAVRTIGSNTKWSNAYATCNIDPYEICILRGVAPPTCASIASDAETAKDWCTYHYGPVGTPNDTWPGIAGACRTNPNGSACTIFE